MKNWTRIGLVVLVSIGGTMSFGYWSLKEFENAFENLSASYAAISSLPVRERLTIATSTLEIATSADSTSSGQATSTESATGASFTTASDQAGIDSKFQLIFSPKKKGVYTGCTYKISWLASTTILSLETALIDAGTREPSGPIASGLARKYEIKPDIQSIDWKVGAVWPGEYFILISNVNGMAREEKSHTFTINEMSKGLNEKEQKHLCEETGGNLF